MLTNFKKNAYLKFLIAILLTTSYSCSDFLEEQPFSFLAPANYYQNESDAFSALTGAYDGLGTGSSTYMARLIHYLTWFGSDECLTPLLASQQQLSNFSFAADHGDILNLWRHIYDAINRANTVIEKVPDIDMNAGLKNQYVAEARFLRALNYFNLVRLWGGVPLMDKVVTSVEEALVAKSSVAEVYELIIADLQYGSEMLAETNQQGRATRNAAKALLAKVYLTKATSEAANPNDYQLCAALAKEVIDSPQSQLVSDYQKAIGAANKFNTESLFEWQADRNIISVGEHSIFGQFMLPRDIVDLVPEAGQTGESNIVSEIAYFNRYDDRDYRKESTFITEGVNRQGQAVTWQQFTYPFPAPAWKYVNKESTTRSGYAFSANYVVLRLADVYLIRAEAINEAEGPTPEAYEMINAIRARARNRDGVSTSEFPENLSNLTKEQFRDAVLEERAIELGFEGHRWFDLVRTKRFVETIKSIHPEYPIGERHNLFPIPANEVLLNDLLEQNPGW